MYESDIQESIEQLRDRKKMLKDFAELTQQIQKRMNKPKEQPKARRANLAS